MSFTSTAYQKHLKFGYGPDFETTRKPTFFNVQIGEATNTGSFQAECVRAAKLISEQTEGKRLLIAMSGGLDSEIVARSFLIAQVPFEAVIFRYENEANLHDIQYAIDFCNDNKIKINFLDINVIEFLNTQNYLKFSEDYFCNSPLFSVHLELCKHLLNDFVVFAGSAPVLRFPPEIHRHFQSLHRFYSIQNTVEKFYLFEYPTENCFCYDHFFAKHQSSGVSNFFLYTPELVLSSLLLGDPILQFHEVQHFSQKKPQTDFDKISYFHSQHIMACLKHRFFVRAGFDVKLRDAKYTGFEKIHMGFQELPPEASVYAKGIDGMTRFNDRYRTPMLKAMPPLKLGQFQISKKDQEFLLSYALNNWASSNVSIL